MYENDLKLFQKLVICLENLPITSKMLTESKIGKGINSIVKDGIFRTEHVSKQGLKLVNTWKYLVKNSKNSKSEAADK
jgi:hypothetical protein